MLTKSDLFIYELYGSILNSIKLNWVLILIFLDYFNFNRSHAAVVLSEILSLSNRLKVYILLKVFRQAFLSFLYKTLYIGSLLLKFLENLKIFQIAKTFFHYKFFNIKSQKVFVNIGIKYNELKNHLCRHTQFFGCFFFYYFNLFFCCITVVSNIINAQNKLFIKTAKKPLINLPSKRFLINCL